MGKPLLVIPLVAQTTVEERPVLSRGGFISQDNWHFHENEIFLLLLLVTGILTGGDPDNNTTRQQPRAQSPAGLLAGVLGISAFSWQLPEP